MRKYQKAGSVKKEPKPKTTTTKNIFGRTSTYTQTGPDRDNTFKETITDRKGRVRREITGSHKEKGDEDILDTENSKRYNKKGVLVKEKNFSAVGPSTDYTMDKSTTKKGVPVRSMNYVYKEEPKSTTEVTTRTNRKGKVRVNDQSTGNINTTNNRLVTPRMKSGGTMKKYQTPGSVVLGPPKRTKLSVVSPNGDYKTTTRTRNTPNSNSQSTRTRRTVQGALKGAPKVNMVNPPLNNSAVPLTPPSSGSFMKRGGSKKSTISKRKK